MAPGSLRRGGPAAPLAGAAGRSRRAYAGSWSAVTRDLARAVRSARPLGPGADATEPFRRDPRDIAGFVAKRLGRKNRFGAEVDARETVQQNRGAAFGEPRSS